MRTVWWTTLLLLAPVPAQDTATKPTSTKREYPREYQQVDDEFKAATKARSAALSKIFQTDEYKEAAKARDQETIKKLTETVPAVDSDKFGARMLELAAKEAGKEDAVPYLTWVVLRGGDKHKVDALATLRKDHITSAQLLDLLKQPRGLDAVSGGAEAVKGFFQEVIDRNKDPLVRAHAMHALALKLTSGKDVSDEAKAKALELLVNGEKLAKGTDLAATIQALRFEKERLQIGLEAPDIAAEDLDGVPFKLSDYRGKVVVLDFWGDW